MQSQWKAVKRTVVNVLKIRKPNRPAPKPRMSKKRQRDLVAE